MDYFDKCKTNWERMYGNGERWEKLQAKWCKYTKDKKLPLLHMALVDKKKKTSVNAQQDIVSGAPKMFIFPGDQGYDGDEYEQLRCESGASNATGLLNIRGPNEINEDLQQMNGAQLDGDDYDEENENNKDKEEEEEKGRHKHCRG